MAPNDEVHLLIVEDDSRLSSHLAQHLELAGYRVYQTTSEQGALDLIDEVAPQLLIVDGVLEQGSGLDLIRQLGERADRPPVVFISSFWRDLESLTMLLEQLKVEAVMHKPFGPAELVARVDSILGVESQAVKPDKPSMAHLEAMLEGMRAGISRTLPGRVASLRQVVAESVNKPTELDKAIRLAHSIAGTAGTFEFIELSAEAAAIEELLLRILRRDGVATGDESLELADRLEAARIAAID